MKQSFFFFFNQYVAEAINSDTLSSLSSLYANWGASARAYKAKFIGTMTETIHLLQHSLSGSHCFHSPEIPGLQDETPAMNSNFCYVLKINPLSPSPPQGYWKPGMNVRPGAAIWLSMANGTEVIVPCNHFQELSLRKTDMPTLILHPFFMSFAITCLESRTTNSP